MLNMLKKEFLLGIGVGFIISAALVSLFGPHELNDQEIMDRAAKLGMVEQSAPAVDTAVENAGEDNDGTVNTGTTVNSGAYEPKAGSGGKAVSQQQEQPRSIKITITSGMGSESIARRLEEKGAVSDQHEFLKVVTEHKAHTRFQNGTFTIPAGADMDRIVKILTGR